MTNSRSPDGAERGSSTSAAAASLEDDDTPSDSPTGQCSLTLSHNLHSEVRGSPLTTGRYPCAASEDTAPEKSLTSGVSSDVATRGSSTSVATASLEVDNKPDTSTASPEIKAPRPRAALRRGRRFQAGPASQGLVPLLRATRLKGRYLSHPQAILPHPPAEPAPTQRRRRPRGMPEPAEVLSRDQLPLPCDEETCPHKESLQHVIGKYEDLKTENIRLKDLADEGTDQMKTKEEEIRMLPN
ncbi:hypothetical protein CAPTEDRAFT_202408 [Capitella teleta]|uniref:Uncharacterized protein n=1 Tax=Capitella teleta TaxID=283909 RepID=R7UJL3_CAPTE|nr:hypothetical protein CAPTEDRAFT_202408 [Capitella teleta]|eukprot:ELU03427.1 hypothetical protein CAPTEDRAFT_202408 [Capitella teleta]